VNAANTVPSTAEKIEMPRRVKKAALDAVRLWHRAWPPADAALTLAWIGFLTYLPAKLLL
jgi:hypothetical protein